MTRVTTLVVFVLIVILPAPLWAVSLLDIIYGLTNWGSCLDFRIEGMCIDPVTQLEGVRVSYRLPHLLLDAVKIPGDSTIDELAGGIGSLGLGLVAGGGALANTGEWNLQYSEEHVVEWPMLVAMQLKALPIPEALWCVEHMQYGDGLVVNYLSEFDAPLWRSDLLSEGTGPRLGVWALLRPRTGFVVHYSPAVASAVFGCRGTHIAASPGAHLVLKPLWFGLDMFGDDRLQLAIPVIDQCVQVGTNPLVWDHGKGARDGKYLWIYWHRVSCCKPGISPEDVPGLFLPSVTGP